VVWGDLREASGFGDDLKYKRGLGWFRIKSRGVWGDLELKVGGLGGDLREASGFRVI